MSDQERGAYTPPTDSPLSFDARQPVRGTRPAPVTMIISILVLVGLAAAIFVFYRSGVRQAGQPPATVGTPVDGIKSAAPPEAQPQDPAAGLQIYQEESDKPPAAAQPQFTAPPEQPQPRAPAPTVVITPPAKAPTTPVTAGPALRPAIPAAPPAAAPAPKAAAPAKPAPTPVAKAAPAAPPAPKAAPAPASAASGGAIVQIGAVSSQALADKAWSEAVAIAPSLAAGKGKSVQKIDKDGKSLYRTAVTGFATHEAGVAFCARLKAAGKNCFVR